MSTAIQQTQPQRKSVEDSVLSAEPSVRQIIQKQVDAHETLMRPVYEMGLDTKSVFKKGMVLVAMAIAVIVMGGLLIGASHFGLPLLLLGVALLGFTLYHNAYVPLTYNADAVHSDVTKVRLADVVACNVPKKKETDRQRADRLEAEAAAQRNRGPVNLVM